MNSKIRDTCVEVKSNTFIYLAQNLPKKLLQINMIWYWYKLKNLHPT